MGSRGTVAKVNSTREDRNRVQAQSGLGLPVDTPPDADWRSEVQHSWTVFLESPVNGVVADIDELSLRRLFTYYNAHAVAVDGLMDAISNAALDGRSPADGLVDTGSLGQVQPAANLRVIEKLEAMIVKLEERFGIAPLVRARLGINMAVANKMAAEAEKASLDSRERPDEM